MIQPHSSHRHGLRTGRRSRLLPLLAAASVVALSSCSVSGTPAASVGTATLSDDDFTALLADFVEHPDFGPQYTNVDSSIRADGARNLLTLWISSRILESEIERRGASIGQADLDETDAMLNLEAGEAWAASTDRIRDFYLDVFTAQEVFSRVVVPADDELEALYLQGGRTSGVSCPRHILVETEAEALDLLDELTAGADFAALAAERSIDTFTGAIGGVVEPAEGAACFTTGDFQQTIIPEFVNAVLDAEIGVPTGPFSTQFGWHIIVARPFDEVADGVTANIGGTLSTTVQQELITSATAQVASKYGTWVPEVGSVLPVGRLPANLPTTVPTNVTTNVPEGS